MIRELAFGVLVLATGTAQGATSVNYGSLTIATPSGVADTLTVSNQIGAALSAYPLQFGRPFVEGTIPAGQCPVLELDGIALASQADIKNRFPDGSVEFAILAAMVPLPADTSLHTITVSKGLCNSPSALTTAQMLDPSYNFDAVISVTGTFAGATAQTASARTMLSNGNCVPWTQGPIAQTMMCADDSAAAMYDLSTDGVNTSLRPRFYATFWPATHQVSIRAVGEDDSTTKLADLTYSLQISLGSSNPAVVYAADLTGKMRNGITGLSVATAETSTYTGVLTVSGTPTTAPTDGTEYAMQDVATGDIFPVKAAVSGGVTTWTIPPATGRGWYVTAPSALSVGDPLVFAGPWNPGNTGFGFLPKRQWALSNWDERLWLGGAPPAQVNIDPNLAYLESTRWLPNYDTTIVPTATAISNMYALWSSKNNDLYDAAWDGGNQWQSAIATTGQRPDIGPYPSWDVMWLYTGDWRARQQTLGMADLAPNFPAQLRETMTGKRLLRTDTAGASTGLGLPLSLTDRRSLMTDECDLTNASVSTDRVTIVGPNDCAHQPYGFDGAHQPNPFFVSYVLTGDPFYLNEQELWAGLSAGLTNPGNIYYGRGPTGAEGGIADQLRGAGWEFLHRVETALIVPDNDPEKTYFTTLANDAMARWEGGFKITGTVFDGTTEKNFGVTEGNYYSANNGSVNAYLPPPLGNWESNGGLTQDIITAQNAGSLIPGVVGFATSPWMQNFTTYPLGRAKELGFAAEPLLAHTAAFDNGMITQSGNPMLIVLYRFPVEKANGGGYFLNSSGVPDWPSTIAQAFEPNWLDGTCGSACSSGPLSTEFNGELYAEGYAAQAIPAIAMGAGEANGAAAWSWTMANVYQPIENGILGAGFSFAGYTTKWAIQPRTDTNVLPAMPVN